LARMEWAPESFERRTGPGGAWVPVDCYVTIQGINTALVMRRRAEDS
jgi:hypothetical protein